MRPRLLPVFQIVLGAVALVALLLTGIGAILPRHWRVERSLMINAPSASVHRWAADLAYWPRWAQWDHRSLAPENQLGDPSAGVGATLRWRGPAGGATGSVRITASDPERGVWFEHRVDTGKPSFAALLYTSKPGVTEVTWRDEGELSPIVGGYLLDYFQMRLGQHMGEGLARLKQLVEQTPQESPKARD